MRAYYIIIIYLIFLVSGESAARTRSALGRFAQTDSSYDYNRQQAPRIHINIDDNEPLEEPDQDFDRAGLIINGFPEGCAYATMDQALPGHFLGFGRINFMGSSWAFEYTTQTRAGAFQIAEVAPNLGRMGQNPEQNLSVDLMARTPGENYVVAQLLDRSDLGLGPIVTCISPVFRGRIIVGQPIVFGRDYWSDYNRFLAYRKDSIRWRHWLQWQRKWREDSAWDWRRSWRERKKYPKPKPKPDKNTKPVVRPRPKPDNNTTRPIVRPRPRPEPDDTTRPIVRPRPRPEPDNTTRPIVRPRPRPEPDNTTRPTVRPRPRPKPDNNNGPVVRPRPRPELDDDSEPVRPQPKPERRARPGIKRNALRG